MCVIRSVLHQTVVVTANMNLTQRISWCVPFAEQNTGDEMAREKKETAGRGFGWDHVAKDEDNSVDGGSMKSGSEQNADGEGPT